MSHSLASASDGHPDLVTQLVFLGDYHFSQVDLPGDLDHIKKAIRYLSIALRLTPNDHPGLPSVLINLGASHLTRFWRLDRQDDIEKAIKYMSTALTLISDGHSNLLPLLIGLGVAYAERFKYLNDIGDLEKAIKCKSRALSLIPDDHPNLLSLLNNLGMSHSNRFQCLGELHDLDTAIECESRALALAPECYPDLPTLLGNLGVAHGDRFWRTGGLDDLKKAIEHESRALSLTPSGHPELPSRLTNLGTSHTVRFRCLGELDDIEKAIEYTSTALTMITDGHPDLPSLLSHLGVSHNIRFQRLGELDDLEKAIKCKSRGLSLLPDDHPGVLTLLGNLGIDHAMRFRCLDELDDLEKAITFQSRALALTPSGHPHLPSLLINLGASYSQRFGRLRESGDIDKAIECEYRALALTPVGHSDLPFWLTALGASHSARFRHLGERSDIEKAITCQSHALALTPDGDPNLSLRYHGLARSQFILAQCCDDLYYLQNSLDSYRKASNMVVGAPRERFSAAVEWSSFASKHSDLNCIEAYQTAIDLLPQFIWLGATTNQRYQDLVQANNLAVNAALAAILSSNYSLALEWLEHARCVVWGQNLMLRSPLDQFHSSHPDFATRLKTVASQLHQAGSESRASQIFSSNAIVLERAAQQHRRLAKEYNGLLSEARKIPGFEDVLQLVKANELVRAARNGPVAVINCNRDRSDALVIFPGQDEIAHVSLPNFSGEKALRCRTELETSLRRKGIRERGVKVRQEAGQNYSIENVLATLWNDVVKPVLDTLGYTNNAPTNNLPHITWCPTGALSFLPLHAAGDYNQPRSRVFDYVISSYTPTLTALLTSAPSSLHRDCRVLAIGQPNTPGRSSLPGTIKELASVKALLDAMETHDWIHLACHAHQNVDDPTKSGFFLHDGTLDLALINRRSLKNKGLAFLSACQTATGDENLPDEAVHLASGMLMAGYTSVIATMWSVNDADAPLVADKVYGELIKGGQLGNGEAGRALHNAVAELRDKIGGKEFSRWVPYIHIGS
ncbi:unnamed protein product [Rhizoctonia solani]|uniref:CHAT domain-containing protein n=1 Tax=Rhizoctonia solani TaxID=456999 RepID=A0A8H2XA05_9AGAM|nr:unnamed protein product [Rhizoctonia solani]